MNKTELTDALADATDMTKADAQRAIDALFDTDEGIITDALQGEEKVQITGFGTFETRERSARMGRIPASMTVNFRSGKGLKDAVNE